MRFMLLVKASEDFEAGILPDEKLWSEMSKYTEELVKAGALLGCERLQASSSGVRVRYANGKFSVIDGPFAETKETPCWRELESAGRRVSCVFEREVEVLPGAERPSDVPDEK